MNEDIREDASAAAGDSAGVAGTSASPSTPVVAAAAPALDFKHLIDGELCTDIDEDGTIAVKSWVEQKATNPDWKLAPDRIVITDIYETPERFGKLQTDLSVRKAGRNLAEAAVMLYGAFANSKPPLDARALNQAYPQRDRGDGFFIRETPPLTNALSFAGPLPSYDFPGIFLRDLSQFYINCEANKHEKGNEGASIPKIFHPEGTVATGG